MDRRAALRVAFASLVIAAGSAPGAAPARESLGRQVWIHDRGGHALDRFHAALGRASRGQGRARIMVWGASHTSEDQFTGFLREAWQRRFGDAGPGFVLPARPFSLYAHRSVRIAESGGWRTLRVRGRQRRPDRYGPAGFAIEATGRAEAFARPRRRVDRARLFYLERPGGGHLEVTWGDGSSDVVSTGGDRVTSRLFRRDGGIAGLRVRARGDGPVRIFGVSLERDAPGVVVDSMGVPGARLRDRLPWDDRAFRRQLAELAPDLIVLAYGTNESGFRGRSLRRYRAEVEEAVTRARATAPRASCLLVGPSDWPVRRDDGGFAARARTAEVIAIQRDVAGRHGCGYFDLVAFQGGPISMPRWVGAGLALPDHIHFTDDGHRVLARVLSRALLRGFSAP